MPVDLNAALGARQPIHGGSVGRWKNYQASLAPLFTTLMT